MFLLFLSSNLEMCANVIEQIIACIQKNKTEASFSPSGCKWWIEQEQRLFEEASSLFLSSPPQIQQHTDGKHRCAGVTATGNSNKWVFLFLIKLDMSTPRKTQWLQLEKNETKAEKKDSGLQIDADILISSFVNKDTVEMKYNAMQKIRNKTGFVYL